MRVNRSELAAFLGVSLPTVNAKIKRGMPYEQKGARGKEWTFDTVEVLSWEKDEAVNNAVGDVDQADETELRRRKLKAETVITEIDAAKRKQEVAEIAELEFQWDGAMVELRNRFRLIAKRATPSVLGQTDRREIEKILLDEIDQALESMAEDYDGEHEELQE